VVPSTDLHVRLERGNVVPACVYRTTSSALAALVLGHGAGAGQRSPFMTSFATALAALGLDVVTFDFPYMAQGRRVPDPRPVLEACYEAVLSAAAGEVASARRHLFAGGKSMGGRVATHVAAGGGSRLAGLVLLGYPLHPPGRPDQRRDAHLPEVRCPMLFVQGSRDTFGTPAELEPILTASTPRAALHVVPGGDHSFTIRGDAPAQAAVYADVQRAIARWIGGVIDQDPAETSLLPR
jgi:predicted alpha/beta-hydrolase family hydrolase